MRWLHPIRRPCELSEARRSKATDPLGIPMNTNPIARAFLLLLVSCIPPAAVADSPSAASTQLQQLDVSAGRWEYHGHFLARQGARPGAWIWHEDCRWSDNRVFMLCSFSNTWAGRHVDSVVVDTYDSHGNTFWHYEIFNSGGSAGKPFAARMRIEGATRTESWIESRHGKSVHARIVYQFASSTKVTVLFQQSGDGIHWQTTATGTGEKVGV